MSSVSLDNQSEVIEIVAPADSKLLSAPLSELGLPKGALVLALVRGEEAIIPKGSQQIQVNDRLIILASREVMGIVESFFATSNDD